ncbi:I20RA protein, partial [Atractosteus spatula]|nr:I20RA protein [Atractosteus spatula]
IYGEEKMGKPVWRFPRQCKEVVGTWCDLSEETSDLDEQYYARVKAVGKGPSQWKTTERFNPKLQTAFGPPLLEVATSERALHIKIKGPMRWQKSNTENANSMLAYYPDMKYNVSIYNNVTKQSWSFLLNKNSVEVGMLDYNTQYCVSARSYLTLPFKCDPSKELCVTTPKGKREARKVNLLHMYSEHVFLNFLSFTRSRTKICFQHLTLLKGREVMVYHIVYSTH